MIDIDKLPIFNEKTGYYTTKDLARRWDLNVQSIHLYINEGGLEPIGKLPGTYGSFLFDKQNAQDWYEKTVVANLAPQTINDVELRLKTAKALIDELKYKKMLGETIDQQEAVMKFAKLLVLIDSKLKEIATLTGPLCAAEDDPQVCIKIIDDAVEKARAEIAGCNLEKLLITDFMDEEDETDE